MHKLAACRFLKGIHATRGIALAVLKNFGQVQKPKLFSADNFLILLNMK
jgi:hypothetical protein